MVRKKIVCPYCGAGNGQRPINENRAKLSVVNTRCSDCLKPFKWTAQYGEVKVYK